MRSPGQHSSNFTALASDPWDYHAIVAGRLVAHPGNHGSLGPMFDRDALCPGHGAAPDRRGMICDSPCHLPGEIIVFSCVKRQLFFPINDNNNSRLLSIQSSVNDNYFSRSAGQLVLPGRSAAWYGSHAG